MIRIICDKYDEVKLINHFLQEGAFHSSNDELKKNNIIDLDNFTVTYFVINENDNFLKRLFTKFKVIFKVLFNITKTKRSIKMYSYGRYIEEE